MHFHTPALLWVHISSSDALAFASAVDLPVFGAVMPQALEPRGGHAATGPLLD